MKMCTAIQLVVVAIGMHTQDMQASFLYDLLACCVGMRTVDLSIEDYFQKAQIAAGARGQIRCKEMNYITTKIAALFDGDLAFSLVPGYIHINPAAFKELGMSEALFTAHHEVSHHVLGHPQKMGKLLLQATCPSVFAMFWLLTEKAYAHKISKTTIVAFCLVMLLSYLKWASLPQEQVMYELEADALAADLLARSGYANVIDSLLQERLSCDYRSLWHPSHAAWVQNLSTK